MKNFRSLKRDNSALVIIDIQERLCSAMAEDIQEILLKNTGILLEAARGLSIPVFLTEQYPAGLGITVQPVKSKIEKIKPLEKICFDCTANDEILKALISSGKKNFILSGIESHICVLQTALSLLKMGFGVCIAGDAVASRKKLHWEMALKQLGSEGACVLPVESIVFQLMGSAGTDIFKKLAPLFR